MLFFQNPSLKYRKLRFFIVFIHLFSDCVHTILHFVINDNKGPIIGLAAHCSGAAAGILLGFIIYSGEKFEKNSNLVQ